MASTQVLRTSIGFCLLLFLVGCDDGANSNEQLSKSGEACGNTEDCESGLVCQGTVCQMEGADCPADRDCEGLECGMDPVCGQSCGSCSDGQTCNDGQCVDESTDDTWQDSTSGLTWQVTPTGDAMNWETAKSHCLDLELDGDGWRLPTIGELRTLIRDCPATEIDGSCNIEEGSCLGLPCKDESCEGCSLTGKPNEGCYWPDNIQGARAWYWSASPVDDYDRAWCIHFGGALVSYTEFNMVEPLVRCVR